MKGLTGEKLSEIMTGKLKQVLGGNHLEYKGGRKYH